MEEMGLLKDSEENLSRLELAAEIRSFLDKHAGMSAWEPDEYASPDAAMLSNAALHLEMGIVPDVVWSCWGSCGYKPYNDEAARAWHDELLEKIKALRLAAQNSLPPVALEGD